MSKRILMVCSTTAVSHGYKGFEVLKTLNLKANKIAHIENKHGKSIM